MAPGRAAGRFQAGWLRGLRAPGIEGSCCAPMQMLLQAVGAQPCFARFLRKALLSGVGVSSARLVTPTGIEPVFQP